MPLWAAEMIMSASDIAGAKPVLPMAATPLLGAGPVGNQAALVAVCRLLAGGMLRVGSEGACRLIGP